MIANFLVFSIECVTSREQRSLCEVLSLDGTCAIKQAVKYAIGLFIILVLDSCTVTCFQAKGFIVMQFILCASSTLMILLPETELDNKQETYNPLYSTSNKNDLHLGFALHFLLQAASY